MKKYVAEVAKGTYTYVSKEVNGRDFLDYVWIQNSDGTKEFYRVNHHGAELELTPKAFESVLEPLFMACPEGISDIKSWVITDGDFLEAMIRAYSDFMRPRIDVGLFALMD